MRVGVVGAGGIGGFFAGVLAGIGHEVIVVARGAHGSAIRQNGLFIDGPRGSNRVSVECVEDPSNLDPVDVLLFCVKAYDVSGAATLVSSLSDANTAIITLQNGLDSSELLRAASLAPLPTPLPGSAYVSAMVSAPGTISYTSSMSGIRYGSLSGEVPENGVRFLRACRDAGLDAELASDIRKELWIKFVLTASTAGLATVGRVPNAVLFREAPLRALTVSAMAECISVAHAECVELPNDLIDRSLALADSFPPDMYASMCLDLLAGRRLELDAFSGAVVERAKRYGIAAPVHQYIYSSLVPLSGCY